VNSVNFRNGQIVRLSIPSENINSMSTSDKTPRDDIEELLLIGVRTRALEGEVDYYALVLYYEAARSDHNRPLTHNRRIVFFREVNLADRVLELGDDAFRRYAVAPSIPSIVYEPLRALALLDNAEYDDSTTILNCGNELLDFVEATGRKMPEFHRRTIYEFLNYATFNRDLSSFFETLQGGRKSVVDAFMWSFGAVWSSSIIIEEDRDLWNT
jgi:hypothetical protein